MTTSTGHLPLCFYAARDEARRHLGDGYEMMMFESCALLLQLATMRHETVTAAALRLARKCIAEDRQFAAIGILAAGAEIIEPSGLPS
jgi:hypothetical protein